MINLELLPAFIGLFVGNESPGHNEINSSNFFS